MNRTVCTLATALLLTQLGPSAQADAALEQLLALSPDQAARQVLTPQERAVLKALEQSNQRGAKGASTKPVVTGPNEVRFIYGASRPMVVCSLLHVCDIALEPGENVLDLKIGDGARWLIERSVSGHEGAIVEHIALKPTDIGLNTNLRIYTDKRTYYLDLKSTAAEFMPQVSFIYPEATLERYHSLKAELSRAQQARAFSGAPQTQMPTKLMATGARLPALVMVNEGGNAMGSGADSGMGLINYRVVGTSFVIDGLPTHLRLLLGSSADRSALRADIELMAQEH